MTIKQAVRVGNMRRRTHGEIRDDTLYCERFGSFDDPSIWCDSRGNNAVPDGQSICLPLGTGFTVPVPEHAYSVRVNAN